MHKAQGGDMINDLLCGELPDLGFRGIVGREEELRQEAWIYRDRIDPTKNLCRE